MKSGVCWSGGQVDGSLTWGARNQEGHAPPCPPASVKGWLRGTSGSAHQTSSFASEAEAGTQMKEEEADCG